MALPVQWVWPVAAGDAVREASTIDISARGLAMRTDAAVAEGQDITLPLRLPGHDVLAVGRVVRAAGPDEATTRVRLDQMAPERSGRASLA